MPTTSNRTTDDQPDAGVTFPLDLSVVIPAWNEAETLEQTVNRISQAIRADEANELEWEIIVCDNASTDDTAEVAERAGARVVFEPERGIARSRNAGARAARGKWLLFIDADTYPPPELLSEVRVLLGEGGIVGAGAGMKPSGGTWWMRYKIRRDNFALWLLGLSPGVFLLCGHEAFRAIGGFNTDLSAFEELGFVFRLKRYGRARGLEYPVLRQHPVVTSARAKGGFITMIVSNIMAILLALLPRRLRIRRGWRLLNFWYGPRR